MRTFCCTDRAFPTAIVELKSNFFMGRVEACVLDNPVVDVILGNNYGINNKPPFKVQPLSANPVQTRAKGRIDATMDSSRSTDDVKYSDI